MEIKEFTTKAEMLQSYSILTQVYPSLVLADYERELDAMIPHNYGQIAIFDGDRCVGLSGFWIGTKLWCGKYLEADNVVVDPEYRSKGIGKLLFDYLEEKAKEEKCGLLGLDSYTGNFKAHKFFYNQGYEPRGFHFINVLDKKTIR